MQTQSMIVKYRPGLEPVSSSEISGMDYSHTNTVQVKPGLEPVSSSLRSVEWTRVIQTQSKSGASALNQSAVARSVEWT